jgi:hypothetical protein
MKALKTPNLYFMSRLAKLSGLFILLLANGCDYPLEKENFIEVDKPSESQQIAMEMQPSEDTLVVFKETKLSFQYYTFGLKLKTATVRLQDKSWQLSKNPDTLSIDPSKYEAGVYPVTFTLITNSNTGSIGDQMGAEGYKAEQTYNLLIDGRPAPPINSISHEIVDGHLKVSWPKCEQYNFKNYTVKSTINGKENIYKITDANKPYLIDKEFVGGNITYEVSNSVLYHENGTKKSKQITEYGDYPKINIETIGTDSIRLYWQKSPFNCTYLLERHDVYPYIVLVESETTTSITVKQPPLDQHYFFGLYLLSSENPSKAGNYIQYSSLEF